MGCIKSFVFLGPRPEGSVSGKQDFSFVETRYLSHDQTLGALQGFGIGKSPSQEEKSKNSKNNQPHNQQGDARSRAEESAAVEIEKEANQEEHGQKLDRK